MSAPHEMERLLLFEIASHVFGLPIDGVLEVVEAGTACGVPTLPASLAGVMNWHGEALPLVAPHVLVEADVELRAEPVDRARLSAAQVLVISDRAGDVPRLGLPIDSVLGIADAPCGRSVGTSAAAVSERQSIDGRVVNVLDPGRLVARAHEAIDDMAA